MTQRTYVLMKMAYGNEMVHLLHLLVSFLVVMVGLQKSFADPRWGPFRIITSYQEPTINILILLIFIESSLFPTV